MAELRMRDLCARTGLSRQTIHFYVAQGLLEPPRKTGRTMGYYSEAHVERLQLIRRLQEEHFLPLPAIRAMLADEHGGFSRAQRHVLAEVKQKLTAVAAVGEEAPAEKLADVLARCKLPRRDADELVAHGLLQLGERGKGRGKHAEVSAEGAWLLELWAEVRAAGFTRERGFGPELLLLFERGIAEIFEEEKQILARLAASLPGAEVAAMVDRALPLIHSFLVRAHQRRVRELFQSLGAPS